MIVKFKRPWFCRTEESISGGRPVNGRRYRSQVEHTLPDSYKEILPSDAVIVKDVVEKTSPTQEKKTRSK